MRKSKGKMQNRQIIDKKRSKTKKTTKNQQKLVLSGASCPELVEGSAVEWINNIFTQNPC